MISHHGPPFAETEIRQRHQTQTKKDLNDRELTEISFVSRAIPVVVLAVGLGTASAETKIVLDDADSGRVFEGIGAISQGGTSRNMVDYPAKLKSEILDYMFKPKFGANLQHFKVEIGGGENGTCGSEPTHALTREELAKPVPRGFEFWLMAEARKRNPRMMLDCLPWSYPSWVSSPFSQDSADWYVAFLDVAKNTLRVENGLGGGGLE